MAITGTGYNGETTYSLSEGVLTMVGVGGTFAVRVGDRLNDYGVVLGFNPLTGCAQVEYKSFGDISTKDIPLGELNPDISAFVSASTEPVHTA